MTRRGVANVRLCDRPGCPERWPCSVHGALQVGDYEHLGRHAGQFALWGRTGASSENVLDMAWCKHCGVALCSCPTPLWCAHCMSPRDGVCHQLHPRCNGLACHCSPQDTVDGDAFSALAEALYR